MLDFPDMLPWDEMTALVKRHEEQITTLQLQLHEVQERLYDHQKFLEGYIIGFELRLKGMREQMTQFLETSKENF